MSSTKSFNLILIFIFLAGTCFACTPPQSAKVELTPVTVQLKWTHDAQFAGLYTADQKGYFTEEGLAVTFIPGGANVDPISAVLDGKAQFGIAGATELIASRAQGKPVRAIATIFRRNPTVFFALASTGITRPQDFVGKKIRSVSDQPLVLHAMTAHVGIAPDQYTEVNLPSDVALFASGEVPVWGAYITSTVLAVQRAGYEINIIYPDDYGVHFYGDTLYTTDDFIANHPDLTLRFLRAALKGWIYAIENPTEVGQMVLKYNPDGNAELENAKMATGLPLINTGEDHIGWMKPDVWTDMEQTMSNEGVLTSRLDITQVYTMQFLDQIYK
jgi:NitT/TauT family transport system substrate-binding protein